MNNWNDIWNSKSIPQSEYTNLQSLIAANGFDTGVGSYNEKNWQKLVTDFYKRTNIKKDQNILELGCGSGAFLFSLNRLINAEYFGIDYSPNLIKIAKSVLPNGSFKVAEANSTNFVHIKFDVIFSHSVFQYFPSISYANEVLKIWTKKIKDGGRLVLLDLNDKSKEENYHKNRMEAYRNPKEYYDTYKGLNHLFFKIEDLKKTLTYLGMQDIEIFPHAISDYGNASFRFNLICYKKIKNE